ncbi:MAG TPA: hypothetical protein VF511_07840, partial [Chthoniobacterales bacterium]
AENVFNGGQRHLQICAGNVTPPVKSLSTIAASAFCARNSALTPGRGAPYDLPLKTDQVRTPSRGPAAPSPN